MMHVGAAGSMGGGGGATIAGMSPQLLMRGGGAAIAYAGALHSLPSTMGPIEGIGRIENGEPHGEERIGMGTIYTPGVRPADSSINITIPAKMWSNGWHTMYLVGMPLFILNGVDRTSAMKIPAPKGSYMSMDIRHSLIPASTVMTISQVNAFNQAVSAYISDIIKTDATRFGEVDEWGDPAGLGNAGKVKKVVSTIPEIFWADIKLVETKDSQLRGMFMAVTDFGYGKTDDGFDRMCNDIKAAYARADNLCFYNGIYLRRYLRFAGIVQSVTPSERTGTMNVGTTVSLTSQCLTYWPTAQNFDYVGFCLTKIANAFPPNSIPNVEVKNAFAFIPWSSTCLDRVFIDKVMRTTPEYSRWGRDSRDESTQIYCIGQVVRNDYMRPLISTVPDYLVHGAGPDKSKEAMTLSGISNFDGAAVFSAAFELSKMRQTDMIISVQMYP